MHKCRFGNGRETELRRNPCKIAVKGVRERGEGGEGRRVHCANHQDHDVTQRGPERKKATNEFHNCKDTVKAT